MKLTEISHDINEWFSGSGPQGDIVVSSRIRLARNLAGHKFLNSCSDQEKTEILESLKAVITTLDDTSTIKLDFTVPETFVPVVKPGLEIAARSIAYPDASFAGKVSSVDSRVDPATRSVTVRALLPNPEGLLKPGMFLTTRLSRGAIDALLVPEQALVPEGGEMFVFVAKDGVAEKRRIRIGERRVGDVQVVEGLASGDLIVTEGTQKLRDGAAVSLQTPEAGTAS